MTIAACYLSPEGVVLGADSTATFMFPDRQGNQTPHYFNHGQKIFQIGEGQTLGITMWGLGGLGPVSYRTLIARLADDFAVTSPGSVQDATDRWNDLFWNEYSTIYGQTLQRANVLIAQPNRTQAEEEELLRIDGLLCGFCIGGYCLPDRTPAAFAITYNPRTGTKPAPVALQLGWNFWGAPNLVERVAYGIDSQLFESIVASPFWSGTAADLRAIAAQHYPAQDFILSLRDAIDFVHSSIYSTIKALKFSKLHQICGGPVEIAVISTDRRFRWVRHKQLGEAIDLERGTNAE